MTKVTFYVRKGATVGFSVVGHSGYAEKGSDIVCAAISELSQYVINLHTDVLKLQCKLRSDNSIPALYFCRKNGNVLARMLSHKILMEFYFNLMCGLCVEYPDNITIAFKKIK